MAEKTKRNREGYFESRLRRFAFSFFEHEGVKSQRIFRRKFLCVSAPLRSKNYLEPSFEEDFNLKVPVTPSFELPPTITSKLPFSTINSP